MSGAPSHRLVAFSWGPKALVEGYITLAKYLAEAGMECLFLTDAPAAKLVFLKAGLEAFTIEELAAKQASPSPISIEERRWVMEVEQHLRRPYVDFDAMDAAWSTLIEAAEPGAALIWNGARAVQRIGTLVCRRHDMPCFYLERGLLPGAVVVDPIGVNYSSHIGGPRWAEVGAPAPAMEDREKLRAYLEDLSRSGRTVVRQEGDLEPAALRAHLGIPSDARCVLAPMQIEEDSNILLHSPHFQKMTEVIQALQEALRAHENTFLIVKPHPEDAGRLDELRQVCGDRTRLCTDMAPRPLLRLADVVGVVNSTVGLEALTEGKPVVVLGNAIYGRKGFTFDIDSPSNLRDRLAEALHASGEGGARAAEFERFLVYLLRNCLFSLLEEDPWGSREQITERMLATIATAGASGRPEPAGFAPLKQAHEPLRTLWSAGAGKSMNLLFVGGPPSLVQDLQPIPPGLETRALTRGTPWPAVARCLLRSYDVALLLAGEGLLRRAVWPLVRARRKIVV